MKKLAAVFMMAVIVMSLFGCSGSKDDEANAPTQAEDTSSAQDGTQKDQESLISTPKDLVLKETGWSVFSDSLGTKWVTYGAVVENPNDSYAAKNFQIRVTARNTAGTVVGTSSYYGYVLWAKESVGCGDGMSLAGDVDKVEFELIVQEGSWAMLTSFEASGYKSLSIINQNISKDDYSIRFLGEVKNANNFDIISVQVSALFRGTDGKITGGFFTYSDIAFKNGGTSPFTGYAYYKDVPYKTVDFYALQSAIPKIS